MAVICLVNEFDRLKSEILKTHIFLCEPASFHLSLSANLSEVMNIERQPKCNNLRLAY